jgi:hypothetical protein
VLAFVDYKKYFYENALYMKYFDCHAHVILKQLFSENVNIDTRISTRDVSAVPQQFTDLPNIIKTQIHQSQLASFNEEVIAGVVLYACERNLAEEVVELQKYLKKESQHKMSLTLLNDIKENKYKAFSDFIMKRTLEPIKNSPQSFNILIKPALIVPFLRIRSIPFSLLKGVTH